MEMMPNGLLIATERLLLRSLVPGDAEAIFSYRSDAVANRYQGWIPETIGEVNRFLRDSISPDIDIAGTWHQLAIITKDRKEFIGDIGIHFLDEARFQAELGITLGKTVQGQGYATEALKAVIDFLFNELNKRRITASIDPGNARSIALVERLGFRKEAHFRESLLINGQWTDDLIYALLKTDWTAKGSTAP